MSPTVKLVLVLIGLAYLISPADLIPDLLMPWVGWIDDGLVLWTVYYLIRYGELPWFLFKKKGIRPGRGFTSASTARQQSSRRKRTGAADREKESESGQSKPGSRASGSNAGQSAKDPYEILGIGPGASWDDIQAAYKTKIKQYHPDKLSHLGEEFSTLANKRFLDIQAAYNRLKNEKGR